MRRLGSALLGLPDSVTETERRELVRRYLHHLNLEVDRSALDAEDRVIAPQETDFDKQHNLEVDRG